MIIVGADERVDGDDGITAWAILDDHWLAPACRKPVRKKPRADIRPAAGSKRYDEFDRPCRPRLACTRCPASAALWQAHCRRGYKNRRCMSHGLSSALVARCRAQSKRLVRTRVTLKDAIIAE